MIPFSPPRIDDVVINEVTAALKVAGLLLTTNKTFEKKFQTIVDALLLLL